jgi:hypothetical protein
MKPDLSVKKQGKGMLVIDYSGGSEAPVLRFVPADQVDSELLDMAYSGRVIFCDVSDIDSSSVWEGAQQWCSQ